MLDDEGFLEDEGLLEEEGLLEDEGLLEGLLDGSGLLEGFTVGLSEGLPEGLTVGLPGGGFLPDGLIGFPVGGEEVGGGDEGECSAEFASRMRGMKVKMGRRDGE